MGCDIHLIAQRKLSNSSDAPVWSDNEAEYEDIRDIFLDYRSYGLFGFLAGVRNYSAIPPISKPRGIPSDFHTESHPFREADSYYHSKSWLSVQELAEYDYDQIVEDRRVTINGDGGCTAEPGGGEQMPLREFLGQWYFTELERLQAAGADRIVFCFDN